MKSLILFAAFAVTPLLAVAQEKVDLLAVHRIKTEAFDNSKVMDHAFFLTDVYGPRLTNSPNFMRAAEWAAKQFTEWGLVNVNLEGWGPFGRSWNYTNFSANLLEPSYAPLIGVPLAWSSATNGVVSGQPIYCPIKSEQDLEKWRGKLKGQIVLADPLRDLQMVSTPPAKRLTDADLAATAQAPEPGAQPQYPSLRDGNGNPMTYAEYQKFRAKVRDFLIDEGVAVAVFNPTRGDGGGTVFGQSAGDRDPKTRLAVPSVALTPEHYNRIVRLLERGQIVKVAFEIQSEVSDTPSGSVNVIAEIPGGKKKDEIVMLGAHLDSWQGATGATDNATGVAIVMEAVRILKSLNLPLDRTVRVALWSAEEQGLLGSKAYVKAHFADPEVMLPSPEHAKISCYFNYDNGGGKIRGIYLQSNDMARPIFEAWFAPFHDLGASTVSIRNTGSTDHVSFDKVGIPGFQFIQEPLEYGSRSHHSNMDTYDRIQKSDLMESAAIMASLVYDAANRPEMIPRKPLPKAEPKPAETKPEQKKIVSEAR
jgi:carboxypeptidase Q